MIAPLTVIWGTLGPARYPRVVRCSEADH